MKRMLVSLMLVFATAVVYAATYTWDGGGADNNWSTGANWNPDGSVPVSASDTLVQLDGTNRTSVAQNIAGPFVLNRLEFLDGPFADFRIHSRAETAGEIFTDVNALFCEGVMEILRVRVDRNKINPFHF